MVTRSTPFALAVLASVLWIGAGAGAAPASAQEDLAPIPPRPAKHSSHKVKQAKAVAKPAAPPALEPWAAVDPGRVSGAAETPADPNAAPVPGLQHTVRPQEDRLSYGLKWSSTTAPNPGQYSNQGVVNEVNHNLGAPSDVGTSAEAGVGLKF